MDITKDYYQILGIASSASTAQIRQAYRVLAMRWHPDMHAGEPSEKVAEAEERFKAINEAYGVLSDASQKANYDYIYFRHHAGTTQSQPSQTQTRSHARTWTYSRAKTNSYAHASQARGQAKAESRRHQEQEDQQTGRHRWHSWSWGPDEKNNSDISYVAIAVAMLCWLLYGILSGKALKPMEPYKPPKPVHKEYIIKSAAKKDFKFKTIEIPEIKMPKEYKTTMDFKMNGLNYGETSKDIVYGQNVPYNF